MMLVADLITGNCLKKSFRGKLLKPKKKKSFRKIGPSIRSQLDPYRKSFFVFFCFFFLIFFFFFFFFFPPLLFLYFRFEFCELSIQKSCLSMIS